MRSEDECTRAGLFNECSVLDIALSFLMATGLIIELGCSSLFESYMNTYTITNYIRRLLVL